MRIFGCFTVPFCCIKACFARIKWLLSDLKGRPGSDRLATGAKISDLTNIYLKDVDQLVHWSPGLIYYI